MKKLIQKLMSLAIMTTLALNLAISSSWAAITESGYTSFTYAANGVLQTATSYTINDGAAQLSSKTFYDAMGRPSYAQDGTGVTTAHYNYNALTGNRESVDYIGTGADGATHVYTQYDVAAGVSVIVDHGSGATLSEKGTSGGTNNYTYSQVQNAYEELTKSGSTATWASLGINVSSVQLSGAVINSLSTTQLAHVLGYAGVGATGQMSATDLQSIKTQAAANLTSSFSFTMNNSSCASTYTYFDKASGQSKNMTITTIAPVSTGDPLVTGSITNVRVIPDNSGVNHYYAEVKASQIDMFDGQGSLPSDGETILVAVDEATAANLQSLIGQEITISGNVTTKADGATLTMVMNEGGFVTGNDSHQKWMESRQSFYETTKDSMVKFYDKLGMGNADRGKKWQKLEETPAQPNF